MSGTLIRYRMALNYHWKALVHSTLYVKIHSGPVVLGGESNTTIQFT